MEKTYPSEDFTLRGKVEDDQDVEETAVAMTDPPQDRSNRKPKWTLPYDTGG